MSTIPEPVEPWNHDGAALAVSAAQGSKVITASPSWAGTG